MSVVDSLMGLKWYEQIGLIEKPKTSIVLSQDETEFGQAIVGTDDDLERLFKEGYTDAFITVGSIGDITVRKKLYSRLKEIGYHIPNIVDQSAIVSSSAKLGEGIFIGKGAIVNGYASIGDCVILNTGSIVEHECNVGDFVHLATGAILCGNICVGLGTHIGAGSVVRQGISIGDNTMIGMGSVVVNNIGSNIKAYGNPCKEVEHA